MNIEIANRLVTLRKEKGFSQEQLAEKIGVSRQAVSKWERSEASPDTDNLIMLARLYEVSLDELLRTEDEIPQPEIETEVPAVEPTQEVEIIEETVEQMPPEQPTEQAPSYDKISKKLSVMSDIAWFKVIVFIILAFMSVFVTPPFGFLMSAFAIITIFSLIDAVHFRDLGKFKMWAALLTICSFCLFRSRYCGNDLMNETTLLLLAIPAYEAIMWIIRRIKKKKNNS